MLLNGADGSVHWTYGLEWRPGALGIAVDGAGNIIVGGHFERTASVELEKWTSVGLDGLLVSIPRPAVP